jgi:hypothetical protein
MGEECTAPNSPSRHLDARPKILCGAPDSQLSQEHSLPPTIWAGLCRMMDVSFRERLPSKTFMTNDKKKGRGLSWPGPHLESSSYGFGPIRVDP